jgi:Rrf2 family iron-sulfur cluster assembly transcriptional regulator
MVALNAPTSLGVLINQSFFPPLYALTGVLKMRLSTKSRFAVNAMIDVALREEFGPVPLSDVASRHQISLSYLEQLFSKLRLQGLVTSIRGPGGGYALGRRTDGITVADIIRAVEDAPSKAMQPDVSPVQEMTQDLWDAMNVKVLNFMQSVTLRSLVLDQLAMGVKIELRPAPNRGVFKKPVQQTIRPNVPNSVFALGRVLQVS